MHQSMGAEMSDLNHAADANADVYWPIHQDCRLTTNANGTGHTAAQDPCHQQYWQRGTVHCIGFHWLTCQTENRLASGLASKNTPVKLLRICSLRNLFCQEKHTKNNYMQGRNESFKRLTGSMRSHLEALHWPAQSCRCHCAQYARSLQCQCPSRSQPAGMCMLSVKLFVTGTLMIVKEAVKGGRGSGGDWFM